ncbi:glycogen/starch synthase [Candidatus Shikimatogenerans silvanidophilus]|uniref:glycogen/starch synthase n=1 Tax=Candidatus Shikimatogenerans silvanidophilus TaxID=2782547 RepID=UPI001BAC13BB|nr:glycogen/starch synthase [Candidatus Shikimatogenerans silvanidophilus]
MKKILCVSSSISPFLKSNLISYNVEKFLQYNNKKNDVRLFMPKFGIINERKHQLHEVIRLSGIKININDLYKPLIIKVSSINNYNYKLQVYFIYNEEYFSRKGEYRNKKGLFFKDNDERILFFTKGVIESLKKLNWIPDIIHLHGWFTFLIPIYIKTIYNNIFNNKNTKIITYLYNDFFKEKLNNKLINKILLDGIKEKYVQKLKKPNILNIYKICLDFCDFIFKNEKEKLYIEVEKYIIKKKIKILNNDKIIK